jgi:hypothetical protein
MQAVLRAKLRVSSVTRSIDGDGNVSSEKVDLIAVYSDDPESENKQWSTWTPAASFSMTINNPNAFGKLSNGHEFYLDFIPATDAKAQAA